MENWALDQRTEEDFLFLSLLRWNQPSLNGTVRTWEDGEFTPSGPAWSPYWMGDTTRDPQVFLQSRQKIKGQEIRFTEADRSYRKQEWRLELWSMESTFSIPFSPGKEEQENQISPGNPLFRNNWHPSIRRQKWMNKLLKVRTSGCGGTGDGLCVDLSCRGLACALVFAECPECNRKEGRIGLRCVWM